MVDNLVLPPALQNVLDSLHRETTGLAIACSIRRQLQQAQSPLSLVRRDAYSSLAVSLDAYLADEERAPAVLPALAAVWPQLLLNIAVGLRQAPTSQQAPLPLPPSHAGSRPSSASSVLAAAAGGCCGGGWTAASYRSVSPGELVSMVQVLQLACLLLQQARQASLAEGLLPLLLAQLPVAPPELACACLDALLAIQRLHPPAFVSFTEQQGVHQVCQLVRDKATPEPVRGHAIQFLNLLLTQLVPELLPPEALTPAAAPASPAPASPAPAAGWRAPTEGQPEQQAAVAAGLEAAKEAVALILGREARAMLLRRVSLAEAAVAEQKLGQLASALTLFIESDA